MRLRRLVGLLALPLAAFVDAGAGIAQAPSVTIEAASRLREGDRAEIAVSVRLRSTVPARVLVTPSVEGPAVEVVRGRLLRADATVAGESGEETLGFRVPVVAHAPGTAVLRVHVEAHVCDPACHVVEVVARRPLEVERR